jgi:hypothetical protein
MRVAFANSVKTKRILVRVADLMAKELGWSHERKVQEINRAKAELTQYEPA